MDNVETYAFELDNFEDFPLNVLIKIRDMEKEYHQAGVLFDEITKLKVAMLTIKEMVKKGQYFKIGSFIDKTIENSIKQSIVIVRTEDA